MAVDRVAVPQDETTCRRADVAPDSPAAVADSLITFAAVPAYLHTLIYIIKRRRPSFLFAVICKKTTNIFAKEY